MAFEKFKNSKIDEILKWEPESILIEVVSGESSSCLNNLSETIGAHRSHQKLYRREKSKNNSGNKRFKPTGTPNRHIIIIIHNDCNRINVYAYYEN